jgi:hypothetical protein
MAHQPIQGEKMATKKNAAKKTTKKAAAKKDPAPSTIFGNWIPFCIQIGHSQASPVPLTLSVTGNRFPRSVYFMYQTAKSGTLTLPLGYFVGYGNPGDVGTVPLKIDGTGMTGVLFLNPNANPTNGNPLKWSHVPDRIFPDPPGSGGIIIEN